MNAIKLKYLIIALSVLTGSCLNIKEHVYELINIEIDDIVSDIPVPYTDLFSDFKIIPLETVEGSVFSSFDDLRLINDTLFIFEQKYIKGVLIFSGEGKLISKISKPGRGPGEYVNPIAFDVDAINNEILIFDYANKKMNFYDYQGNFLRDITLNRKYQSFILSDKYIYAFCPFPSGKEDEKMLFQYDRKGNEVSGYINYSSILKGPKVVFPFQGGNFFKGNNDVKFYRPYSGSVYSISNDSVLPFISLNTSKFKLTESDLSGNRVKPSLIGKGKLSHILLYSENTHMAFLVFLIDRYFYKMFFYFNTGKIICAWNLIDDLTYSGTTLFRLHYNHLIGYIHPTQITKFKEQIKSGNVQMPENERSKLLNISDFNNPIIVLFKVKHE
jgi:hypothetical protein